MTTNHLLVAAGILIFMLMIVSTAAVRMTAIWLQNRREDREHQERKASLRSTARMDTERSEWFALVKEKDQKIAELNEALLRANMNYTNAKKLMDKVMLKGEQK